MTLCTSFILYLLNIVACSVFLNVEQREKNIHENESKASYLQSCYFQPLKLCYETNWK